MWARDWVIFRRDGEMLTLPPAKDFRSIHWRIVPLMPAKQRITIR